MRLVQSVAILATATQVFTFGPFRGRQRSPRGVLLNLRDPTGTAAAAFLVDIRVAIVEGPRAVLADVLGGQSLVGEAGGVVTVPAGTGLSEGLGSVLLPIDVLKISGKYMAVAITLDATADVQGFVGIELI